MNIKTFIKSTPRNERQRIAALAGTTDAYFSQLAGGHRKPSIKLAKKIEIASGNLITRQELLPEAFE